ncbi:MAG TPA: hypothetical protein VLV49_06000 [Terriglobales bacterium]|nr:hypothetical protein [Terriglobales bacterium]
MEERLRRSMVGGLLAVVLGFGAFLRTPGAEHVRAVQIVALLAAGMGLGVALANFLMLVRLRRRG